MTHTTRLKEVQHTYSSKTAFWSQIGCSGLSSSSLSSSSSGHKQPVTFSQTQICFSLLYELNSIWPVCEEQINQSHLLRSAVCLLRSEAYGRPCSLKFTENINMHRPHQLNDCRSNVGWNCCDIMFYMTQTQKDSIFWHQLTWNQRDRDRDQEPPRMCRSMLRTRDIDCRWGRTTQSSNDFF